MLSLSNLQLFVAAILSCSVFCSNAPKYLSWKHDLAAVLAKNSDNLINVALKKKAESAHHTRITDLLLPAYINGSIALLTFD